MAPDRIYKLPKPDILTHAGNKDLREVARHIGIDYDNKKVNPYWPGLENAAKHCKDIFDTVELIKDNRNFDRFDEFNPAKLKDLVQYIARIDKLSSLLRLFLSEVAKVKGEVESKELLETGHLIPNIDFDLVMVQFSHVHETLAYLNFTDALKAIDKITFEPPPLADLN